MWVSLQAYKPVYQLLYVIWLYHDRMAWELTADDLEKLKRLNSQLVSMAEDMREWVMYDMLGIHSDLLPNSILSHSLAESAALHNPGKLNMPSNLNFVHLQLTYS